MNKFIGIGNLTAEVELRFTQSGRAVASFTIAINEGSGENKKTTFIDCVAWEKTAEVCSKNLSKGRKVLVEGPVQIRTYETQDGQKRRAFEVVVRNVEFLDYKKDEGAAQGGGFDSMGETMQGEEAKW